MTQQGRVRRNEFVAPSYLQYEGGVCRNRRIPYFYVPPGPSKPEHFRILPIVESPHRMGTEQA